jgi:hypothetical protein
MLVCVFMVVAGVMGFAWPNAAHAASCEAILGKWAWFIGGEVTVNRDGTFTQQSGNAGTWECNDGARGRFTFRWRDGGFVNSLAISPDGQGLTSTDQSQWYVTAQRSAPAPPPPLARQEDCCREAYGCEIQRIEAEFTQKVAQCHHPGNAACFQEAVSTKASKTQAANEKLYLCNRVASGAVISPGPRTGSPASLPAGGDEFHSTDRPGFFSPECVCTAVPGPEQTAGGGGDTFGSNTPGPDRDQPPLRPPPDQLPPSHPPDGPLPWEQPAHAQSPPSCDPTTLQGGLKDEWDKWNQGLADAISDEFQKHTANFRSQYGGARVPLKVTIQYYVQGPPIQTEYPRGSGKKLAYGIYIIGKPSLAAIPSDDYNLTRAELIRLRESFANVAQQSLYATMASYQSRLKFPKGAQCPNGQYKKTGVFSNDPTAPALKYDDGPTRRY